MLGLTKNVHVERVAAASHERQSAIARNREDKGRPSSVRKKDGSQPAPTATELGPDWH